MAAYTPADIALLAKNGSATAQNMMKTVSQNVSANTAKVTAAVVKAATATTAVTSAATAAKSTATKKANTAKINVTKSQKDEIDKALKTTFISLDAAIAAAEDAYKKGELNARQYQQLVKKWPIAGADTATLVKAIPQMIALDATSSAIAQGVASFSTTSEVQKTELQKKADANLEAAKSVMEKANAAQKANSELERNMVMRGDDYDLSVSGIVNGLVQMAAAAPDKLNEYVQNPQALLTDVAAAQKALSESEKLENKAVGEISKVVLDVNKLNRAVYSYDLLEAKPVQPGPDDYLELALLPLAIPSGGGDKVVAGAVKGVAKIGVDVLAGLGVTLVELSGKELAEKTLAGAVKEAGEGALKAVSAEAETVAAKEFTAINEAAANVGKYAPGAVDEFKAALNSAIKNVPKLEQEGEFIIWARKFPDSAARLIAARSDEFLRLPKATRDSILTELATTLEGKRALRNVLEEAGADLVKKLPAATKAAAKKATDGNLVMGMLKFAVAGISAVHIAAMFQLPDMMFPVDAAIKAGRLDEARRNLEQQKAVLDAAGAVINLTRWWPIIGASGAANYDLTMERVAANEERLIAAEKAAGIPPEIVPLGYVPAAPPGALVAAAVGKLQISGNPTGASVFLNGILVDYSLGADRNTTPMTISGLLPGTYTLTVSAKGYDDLNDTVAVVGGERTTYDYELVHAIPPTEIPEELKVLVRILSEPVSGAKIYIDGEYTYRTTPSTFSLAPGTHVLELEADGYDKYEGTFEVRSGEDSAEYAAQLTRTVKEYLPSPGYPPGEVPEVPAVPGEGEAPRQTGWEYQITSEPMGAKIYVNGNNTFKYTPGSVILAGNADYVLMVDLYGYKPAFATVHTDPV